MAMLIWIGAALSVLGMVGIIVSIVMVAKAKRAGLEDTEMRARISKILPLNMGALFVSMIGLMMVIVGIILA
ncbi:MAG: hypothetical protein P8H36_03580 [Yoonia sp.]|nr:hypothetical protein [Yoonia sp.]MDG1520327.1 hypothetical protein [Yoonia sp.]MDG1768483.1 hypothetical protein [Yoonia sp.]MDG1868644.1 hypothetical protein [Yoonia sp.]